MPLPTQIEIVPLTAPVQAEITVPGSKSITNRALILAALADGETKLQGALWSEDTQVMVEALWKLGFGGKDSECGDDGETVGAFCGECGDGSAVFIGVGLFGERSVSVARRAADAR